MAGQVDCHTRDLRGITWILSVLVVAVVLLPLVLLLVTGEAQGITAFGGDDLVAAGIGMVVGGIMIAWLATAITWMAWARLNVQRSQPGGRWGAGWAVGAWFVPIGYLVLGYFVIRDIWHGTHHKSWASVRLPGWVLAGWLVWAVPKALAHGVLAARGVVAQYGLPGYPVWHPSSAMAMQAAWILLDLVAAVFFLRFIHVVAARQQHEFAARLGSPVAA